MIAHHTLSRSGSSVCAACLSKSSISSNLAPQRLRSRRQPSSHPSSSFLPSRRAYATDLRPLPTPTLQTLPQLPSPPLSYSVPPYFRILAVESSADDTCASVVDSSRKILSNVVRKQHDLHMQFGGIHPLFAQDAHAREMPGVISQALREASVSLDDIDGIAFTQGPGMHACLEKGCTAAGALAAATGKPLFGINHMQAHALTPLMTEDDPPTFPYLTFLMSGGHSQILLSSSYDEHLIIVDTGALAVGQAFDRVGKDLNLPFNTSYGFGRAVEDLAASVPSLPLPPLAPLRLPVHQTPQFAFQSFHLQVQKALCAWSPPLPGAHILEHDREGVSLEQKVVLARAFQGVVADEMEERLRFVVKRVKKEKERLRKEGEVGREEALSALVISGGVASNVYLRSRLREFAEAQGMRLVVPPLELCTDNAAMIANVAVDRFREGKNQSYADVIPRRKWSIENLCAEREVFGVDVGKAVAGGAGAEGERKA